VTLVVRNIEEFQSCREHWSSLVAEGEFERALELIESALLWVREHGDSVLLDRVLCNRAAIATELGRGAAQVAELRALLMRSEDVENAYLAAYTIARQHELAREPKKGLFYAQLARDRAAALGAARLSESLNLIANFQVSASRFDDALISYAEAEAHLESETGDSLRSAVIGYNVGYCRVVTGDCRGGLAKLYRSLRALRRLGARRHEMLAHLDLTFALLEAGSPRHAARHAGSAIELARHFRDDTARKNGLYLAGAAAAASGDEFRARRYFAELQGSFFPDADYLPELLLQLDVRQLVNLKA
jgi:hypothetical protein